MEQEVASSADGLIGFSVLTGDETAKMLCEIWQRVVSTADVYTWLMLSHALFVQVLQSSSMLVHSIGSTFDKKCVCNSCGMPCQSLMTFDGCGPLQSLVVFSSTLQCGATSVFGHFGVMPVTDVQETCTRNLYEFLVQSCKFIA